jgi:hypothetical protein
MGQEIISLLEEYQKKSRFPSQNYLCKKEFSWRYVRYRIMRPIIKVMYYFFRKKYSPSPWLSPAATLFFDQYLNSSHRMAEFGSGLSTVFFAERVGEIISIEHYEPWYKKVKVLLHKKGLENVDYRLIKMDEQIQSDKELEQQMHSTCKQFSLMTAYKNYYNALSSEAKESFDIILVDGRARPECVFSSVEKLKSGGLMVLDNSERRRYTIVFDVLKSWPYFSTTTGRTDTTFWIKP